MQEYDSLPNFDNSAPISTFGGLQRPDSSGMYGVGKTINGLGSWIGHNAYDATSALGRLGNNIGSAFSNFAAGYNGQPPPVYNKMSAITNPLPNNPGITPSTPTQHINPGVPSPDYWMGRYQSIPNQQPSQNNIFGQVRNTAQGLNNALGDYPAPYTVPNDQYADANNRQNSAFQNEYQKSLIDMLHSISQDYEDTNNPYSTMPTSDTIGQLRWARLSDGKIHAAWEKTDDQKNADAVKRAQYQQMFNNLFQPTANNAAAGLNNLSSQYATGRIGAIQGNNAYQQQAALAKQGMINTLLSNGLQQSDTPPSNISAILDYLGKSVSPDTDILNAVKAQLGIPPQGGISPTVRSQTNTQGTALLPVQNNPPPIIRSGLNVRPGVQ
jgi:hypothetical protein